MLHFESQVYCRASEERSNAEENGNAKEDPPKVNRLKRKSVAPEEGTPGDWLSMALQCLPGASRHSSTAKCIVAIRGFTVP